MTRYSNIISISHVYLLTCVERPSVVCPCHVLDRTCYDLITQVATLDLRLEDELGVKGRECTID